MLFYNHSEKDANIVQIKAPNEEYSVRCKNSIKIFVAGGITNCPDWQSEFYQLLLEKDHSLKNKNITLYNPRRESFDVSNPTEAEIQICWEHKHLSEADIIVMWFSSGSLNPIVLYELGRYITGPGKFEAVIGIDPEYTRKFDVETQVRLDLGEHFVINNSLEDMVDDLIDLMLDLDENTTS